MAPHLNAHQHLNRLTEPGWHRHGVSSPRPGRIDNRSGQQPSRPDDGRRFDAHPALVAAVPGARWLGDGHPDARQHFLLPAFAPVFYNLAIIAGALFLAPTLGIFGLAWGVVAGAVLHFAVQLPGLLRVGMRYSPRLNLRDPGVSEVGRLILPRIAGQAAFQVNIVAMRSISSFLAAGRLSAFNYAYLIMILPHGIFAMSLATVTFPTMAAQFAEGI